MNNLTNFLNLDVCNISDNIEIVISKFKTDTYAYDKDNEVFIFLKDSFNNLNPIAQLRPESLPLNKNIASIGFKEKR
jgi:hypothetical protein